MAPNGKLSVGSSVMREGLARRWWRRYRLQFTIAAWLAALVFGMVGFGRYYQTQGQRYSFTSLLYLTLKLFSMSSGAIPEPVNWQLDVARFLAPAVAGATALSALFSLLRRHLRALRLLMIRRHAVICGLGRQGALLAQQLRRRSVSVVAIERDQANPYIAPCEASGAIVLYGDATDSFLLREARLGRADYLMLVCGAEGVNAEIATRAQEILAARRRYPLACFAHVTEPRLCQLLRQREFLAGENRRLRLEFFSLRDHAARALVRLHLPFDRYKDPSLPAPHLVVVGFGGLGEALVTCAARTWRASGGTPARPLRVTAVDLTAEGKTRTLVERDPMLGKICALAGLDADPAAAGSHLASTLAERGGEVAAVFVCADDDVTTALATLSLRNWTVSRNIPLIACIDRDVGLISLLRETGHGRAGLDVFALAGDGCDLNVLLEGTHERLARAIHEYYLRDRSGDPPAVAWERLPEGLKESNRLQADHVAVKLRAAGYDIVPLCDWDAETYQFSVAEVELMARMEHERWVEERRQDGWKLGPKDRDRKTSPYLVPYDRLDADTQQFNRDIVSNIPRLLASIDLQVCRRSS